MCMVLAIAIDRATGVVVSCQRRTFILCFCPRSLQGRKKNFGMLSSGNCVFAVEYKEGHTSYSQLFCFKCIFFYFC